MLEASKHDKRSELIELLLRNNADVNAKDSYGNTALINSSYYGSDVVELLLEKGADVNARNKAGKTALMNACTYRGKLQVVRMLVEKGADVNAKDKSGQTALMRANGKPYQFRELLLKYGAKK